MSLGVLEVTGGRTEVQLLEFLLNAFKSISSLFGDVVRHCELIFPKKKSELQANRSVYFKEAQ